MIKCLFSWLWLMFHRCLIQKEHICTSMHFSKICICINEPIKRGIGYLTLCYVLALFLLPQNMVGRELHLLTLKSRFKKLLLCQRSTLSKRHVWWYEPTKACPGPVIHHESWTKNLNSRTLLHKARKQYNKQYAMLGTTTRASLVGNCKMYMYVFIFFLFGRISLSQFIDNSLHATTIFGNFVTRASVCILANYRNSRSGAST